MHVWLKIKNKNKKVKLLSVIFDAQKHVQLTFIFLTFLSKKITFSENES